MDLSARDVHEKQFHDAWRGYNQEEVDIFLDRIAETIDRLQRENRALRVRATELEQNVATGRDTEDMLKKTLLTAQQAAEEAITKAKSKAEALLSEAEQLAQHHESDVRERIAAAEVDLRRKELDADREYTMKRRELETSIDRLRALEVDMKKRLKTFLEQQLRSLDNLQDRAAAEPREQRAPVAQEPQTPRAPSQPAPQGAPAPSQSPEPIVIGETERRKTEGQEAAEHAPATVARGGDPSQSGQRRGMRGLFTRDDR